MRKYLFKDDKDEYFVLLGITLDVKRKGVFAMLTKKKKVERQILLYFLLSFVISSPATIYYLYVYNCNKALCLGLATFVIISLIFCNYQLMCDLYRDADK